MSDVTFKTVKNRVIAEIMPGGDFDITAATCIDEAKRRSDDVRFEFNGIVIDVFPTSSVHDLRGIYASESNRQAVDRYRRGIFTPLPR